VSITANRSPAHWKRPGWPSMATSNSTSISALKYRCFLRPGTRSTQSTRALRLIGLLQGVTDRSLSGGAAMPADHLDSRDRGRCDLE
jgi:hypothetical protein